MRRERIVAAHGNFDSAHVVSDDEPCDRSGSVNPERRRQVDISELRAALDEEDGEVGWRRLNARHKGLVKPSITFFGEDLPRRFLEKMKSDFPKCEVLLIFGTSLSVQPFASLVRKVAHGTPRLLVNRERVGMDLGLNFDQPGTADAIYAGDCDAGALGIMERLGWTSEPASVGAVGGTAAAACINVGDAPPTKARLIRLGLTRSARPQPESVVLVVPTRGAIVAPRRKSSR